MDPDLVGAYSAYLQASLAITLRRSVIHYLDDEQVQKRIDEAMARTYARLRERDYFMDAIEMDGPIPMLMFLENYGRIRVRITEETGGAYRIDFHGIEKTKRDSRFDEDEGELVPKQLITIAEFSVCVLSSRLTIHMEEADLLYRAVGEGVFEIDEVDTDPEDL